MKIIKEDAQLIEDGQNTTQFRIIKNGPWEAEGKYQYKEIVFKDSLTKKYFLLLSSRTGSPFTDYYYSSEDWGQYIECPEVREEKSVISLWKVVK